MTSSCFWLTVSGAPIRTALKGAQSNRSDSVSAGSVTAETTRWCDTSERVLCTLPISTGSVFGRRIFRHFVFSSPGATCGTVMVTRSGLLRLPRLSEASCDGCSLGLELDDFDGGPFESELEHPNAL